MSRTEDEVRDEARLTLGFDKAEKGIRQGTGQITTFNQLGFKGINDKPDGWYLPDDLQDVAIILETKSEKEDLTSDKWVDELYKNVCIVARRYKRTVGILYNGKEVRIFKHSCKITGNLPTWTDNPDFAEACNAAPTLQAKDYYRHLFAKNSIDKTLIYSLTKRINDTLHIDFGIKNLYHRMIFTACALVAKRYDALLVEGMDFSTMKNSILSTLSKSIEDSRKQNIKLDLLLEVYAEIKMNYSSNQEAIDNFISYVSQISECVNSEYWNGEDVMGIFFNEFNRYKKKSEAGQVFTPDHITSLMYRLIDIHKTDYVLDATCGSGAFLVKSMCNMTREAGGVSTKEADDIKKCHLYGIEFDREIFALACANMLIHKDGKTNLEQMDARSDEACKWIKDKDISKVLMNPPYERKYGCMKIVSNVLDSVPAGAQCAIILPDKKLEKDYTDKRYGNKLLRHHTLTTIVKLPENLFFGIGVTTSIFIFETGKPQGDRNIIGYYIEDDSLQTVKNQGRQDVRNTWQPLEDYWTQAIHDGNEPRFLTRQIINPHEHLSYQMPEKAFEIYEEDFMKTIMDYEMFVRGINAKEFGEMVTRAVLYNSNVTTENGTTTIKIKMEK